MAGEYGRSDEGRNNFDGMAENIPGFQPPGGRAGAAPTAGGGSDLDALASQYGATFGGGGFTQESDEPPVYMGNRRRTGMARSRGTYTSRIVPLSEAVGEFYSWSDAQLRKFQEDAYVRGYYGNVDREDVPFGDFDEDTLSIWSTMVQRSAGFYARGRRISPTQALAQSPGRTPTGPEGRERAPMTAVLTNPDDLKEILQAGARSKLGRKLGEAEVSAFIASIQGQERQTQQAQYNAQESGGTVTQMADPRIQAEQAAREAAPVEADSRDLAKKIDMFAGMLGEGGLLRMRGGT